MCEILDNLINSFGNDLTFKLQSVNVNISSKQFVLSNAMKFYTALV